MTDSREPIDLERALREDYEEACAGAKVPSAGTVFWRASIRARADAARKVDQPMTLAACVATAAVIGAGVAMAGIAWPSLLHPSQWTTPSEWTVALCGATVALISPLALVALGSRMRFDRPRD